MREVVYGGLENKARVDPFFSGPFEWSWQNRYRLNALTAALRIRLRERLREVTAIALTVVTPLVRRARSQTRGRGLEGDDKVPVQAGHGVLNAIREENGVTAPAGSIARRL